MGNNGGERDVVGRPNGPADGPSKGPAKAPASGPAKAPAKSAASGTAKGTPKGGPTSPPKGSAKGSARGSAKEPPGGPPAGPSRSTSGWPPLRAFLVGLLIGVVLLGVVWASVAALSGGAGDATASEPRVVDPLVAASDGGSPSAAPGPTRLDRCISTIRVLAVPVDAAEPAMAQWQVHVGAMNKLVVGAITLQQANAFWNQTRLAAKRHIAVFRDAVDRLKRHGVDCPDPALLAGSPALRACARDVAADVQVLHAAQTSIDTWSAHVNEMDMLRLGKLSGTQASKMWLAMWQRGVHELQAYRLANHAARQDNGCENPTDTAGPTAQSSPSSDMSGMDMSGSS